MSDVTRILSPIDAGDSAAEQLLSLVYDELRKLAAVRLAHEKPGQTLQATSNGDYIAKTGTLTFAPGETTKIITIEVKGDSKKEANEKFYLDLFGLSGNAQFTKNRSLGTILNDD